jgi:hypothetical protein
VSDMPSYVRNGGQDSARLSMYTVVGAVAASVLAAGILGGASGILQIPTMAGQLSVLVAARETGYQANAAAAERLRSAELSIESLQRQLNESTLRQTALAARMEKKDNDDRQADMNVQRSLAEIEGRSKDRNTEAMGAINTIDRGFTSLNDRVKSLVESINAMRAFVYDLATRTGKQSLPSQQSYSPTQEQKPLVMPPPLNNNDNEITPQRRDYQNALNK